MADRAEPDRGQRAPARERRRYDSPVRRERARETRERILAAGCELVRGFPTWDWRGLTVGAVAERAGVNKTTVYRHFPTERDLHDAVILRLEDEAGISYEALDLTNLTETITRSFANLSSFAARPAAHPDPVTPTLGADQRRRDALLHALDPVTASWPDTERQMAAAVLDILWSRLSHERLTEVWGLRTADASGALTWAVDFLLHGIRDGHHPTARPDQPAES
ncbi:helix-turn-helix transcriptional regulator [Frankia sp. CNm7]|uniref:Helix-turn-helix transcriptional regulator n=1 Tax=Frankia nepalensis TaxID=1836974 RepID=A0A937REN6_9ACTN|nr:TetR/AcrR family transcriptional regulator [Frankia nepalensis]MBL7499000.1 helix-turn-helix transcriptional regulator [Frankia nepalensis]MBL7511818.1 helix-turn-helix transcriptional regulator [Frankia nepalensis]MBL7522180.1 helix-turn-helix transcriptional regulator [Frankia nepalensis]MBL7630723.1 helix-turn-helix transcriptional regulator [Frankia nepalensis]